MAKIDLKKERRVNKIVAHTPGVRAEVYSAAQDIAAEAETNLLAHRDTTNNTDHEITISRGTVDSFVNLEGPAPAAVEFGHFHGTGSSENTARFVPGLYILHRAAGLI